jgi:hypothetical protein
MLSKLANMYTIGQSVRVKKGIKDPDTGKHDMSHWQGRITELDTDEHGEMLIGIEWDSQTLKNMPGAYIKESIREGYDYGMMYLGTDEVEPAQSRDTLENSREALEEIEDEYLWEDLGEQGERIKQVVGSEKNESALLDNWYAHLEKTLKFPVQGIYTGDSSRNLKHGDRITISGMLDTDDKYGILAFGKAGRSAIEFPLCDAQALEETTANQALKDYVVWFANR